MAAFYYLPSSGGLYQTQTLGQTGDVPVCADYDGDGRADFAVRSSNSWIIKQSSNGQTINITWEQSTDIAVQNDYDGDGKVDIANWRDSNGTWYIRNSTNPSQPRVVQWGQAGDIPYRLFIEDNRGEKGKSKKAKVKSKKAKVKSKKAK